MREPLLTELQRGLLPVPKSGGDEGGGPPRDRRPLTLEDVELDEPRAGEVRVRIEAAGVCHSDLHYMTGDLPAKRPLVVGHEGAGIVEAVGPQPPAGCRSATGWRCSGGPAAASARRAWWAIRALPLRPGAGDDNGLMDGTTRLHKDGQRSIT